MATPMATAKARRPISAARSCGRVRPGRCPADPSVRPGRRQELAEPGQEVLPALAVIAARGLFRRALPVRAVQDGQLRAAGALDDGDQDRAPGRAGLVVPAPGELQAAARLVADDPTAH